MTDTKPRTQAESDAALKAAADGNFEGILPPVNPTFVETVKRATEPDAPKKSKER